MDKQTGQGGAVDDSPRGATVDAGRAAYIEALVADAPPFSAEQRDRLAVLLRPSSASSAA